MGRCVGASFPLLTFPGSSFPFSPYHPHAFYRGMSRRWNPRWRDEPNPQWCPNKNPIQHRRHPRFDSMFTSSVPRGLRSVLISSCGFGLLIPPQRVHEDRRPIRQWATWHLSLNRMRGQGSRKLHVDLIFCSGLRKPSRIRVDQIRWRRGRIEGNWTPAEQ